jgi:hypothetical protein
MWCLRDNKGVVLSLGGIKRYEGEDKSKKKQSGVVSKCNLSVYKCIGEEKEK